MGYQTMECPYCSSETLKVTDKRGSPDGIRRRRECLECGKRFTTYENIVKGDLYVIKKDGKRERYNNDKLEAGIQRAFEKRPIPKERIRKMIIEIEDMIRKRGKQEVKSSVIGEIAMRKIKKIDNVAYIRFASVYKDFQDINDFKQVLKDV